MKNNPIDYNVFKGGVFFLYNDIQSNVVLVTNSTVRGILKRICEANMYKYTVHKTHSYQTQSFGSQGI